MCFVAEPAKFNQPKLTYSVNNIRDGGEENWEDCSAPAFDPMKLRASAAHMPYKLKIPDITPFL